MEAPTLHTPRSLLSVFRASADITLKAAVHQHSFTKGPLYPGLGWTPEG